MGERLYFNRKRNKILVFAFYIGSTPTFFYFDSTPTFFYFDCTPTFFYFDSTPTFFYFDSTPTFFYFDSTPTFGSTFPIDTDCRRQSAITTSLREQDRRLFADFMWTSLYAYLHRVNLCARALEDWSEFRNLECIFNGRSFFVSLLNAIFLSWKPWFAAEGKDQRNKECVFTKKKSWTTLMGLEPTISSFHLFGSYRREAPYPLGHKACYAPAWIKSLIYRYCLLNGRLQ